MTIERDFDCCLPPHHATVLPYSAHPEDMALSLKIECPECQSEWGWQTDGPGVSAKLRAWADEHNRALAGVAVHGKPTPTAGMTA